MTDGLTQSDKELILVRFNLVERIAHWMTALLFGILMLTALPLYFVQVESFVGRRELIAQIHTWTGIALPIPLLISLAGSWGNALRRDIHQFNRWTPEEIAWLKSRGTSHLPKLGKFNPGQKLNALFTGSTIVVMLGTGIMLKWFNFFPINLRTGATFVHDVFATILFVVVAGHIAFALTHRDALKSMVTGKVTRFWAQRNAPKWLDDQDIKLPGNSA